MVVANIYIEILKKYPPRREYIIQMLTDLQNAHPQNYLSEEALKEVVTYTHLSMSAVMGVAHYYSNFNLTPKGKFVVNVCRSPVCINKNPEQIANSILKSFGIESPGKTSPDGLISMSYCECLGRCAEGVSVSINHYFLESPTADNVVAMINAYIKNQPHD